MSAEVEVPAALSGATPSVVISDDIAVEPVLPGPSICLRARCRPSIAVSVIARREARLEVEWKEC